MICFFRGRPILQCFNSWPKKTEEYEKTTSRCIVLRSSFRLFSFLSAIPEFCETCRYGVSSAFLIDRWVEPYWGTFVLYEFLTKAPRHGGTSWGISVSLCLREKLIGNPTRSIFGAIDRQNHQQQLAEKNGRMRKNTEAMHCIAILFSSFFVSFGNSRVLRKPVDKASADFFFIDRWVEPYRAACVF